MDYVHANGWVYLEIHNGVYGLPQYGSLANILLEKRLKKHGYYQCPTTPGLWRQEWHPFCFACSSMTLVSNMLEKATLSI